MIEIMTSTNKSFNTTPQRLWAVNFDGKKYTEFIGEKVVFPFAAIVVLKFTTLNKEGENTNHCTLYKNGTEGVVAPCCNPPTLQPEQSGGRGSNPTSTY